MPSDSLSREIAAAAPVDTLLLEWTVSGTDPNRLEFPRTVRFGRGDTIYVADVERGSLFAVRAGRIVAEVDLPGVEVPYLAGMKGDTMTIFSPASLTFYRLSGARMIDSTAVEDSNRDRTSLVYGAAAEGLYYKRVDPERGSFVATIASNGSVVDTTGLSGPHWRYAGLLKMWGDTLISLSGFRPVVDFFAAPDRARGLGPDPDTLALVGFDSPMLARSRSFIRGDVHEAPLLSSSAASAGDRLFVLNMRAGWLQVDVFGRDGILERRLVGDETVYQRAFFPQDIDVRHTNLGYEIAVAYSEPEPAVKLYLWIPDDAPPPTATRPDAE